MVTWLTNSLAIGTLLLAVTLHFKAKDAQPGSQGRLSPAIACKRLSVRLDLRRAFAERGPGDFSLAQISLTLAMRAFESPHEGTFD